MADRRFRSHAPVAPRSGAPSFLRRLSANPHSEPASRTSSRGIVRQQPSRAFVVSAEAAGLRHVTDSGPGIRRRRSGTGFSYVDPDGRVIREREHIRRFRSLAIPPAWSDVWICPIPEGHLQVTARDARGRKQYRYHPHFRARRDHAKFERMVKLSDVLSKVREHVERDIALPGLPRSRVMATIVWLLERTLIRVGSALFEGL